MAYWESDEALSEIHDEIYSEQQKKPTTGVSAMDQGTKFWMAAVAGVILILFFLEKITMKTAIVFGVIGLIMLFLMKGTTTTNKELTYLECMIRLQDILSFLQSHPIGDHEQIPPGEIRVYPVGKKQYYEGKPFKRSFEVRIYDKELDIEDIHLAEVDVFTGDIITFKRQPEGVSGDEKKDIKIMPGFDLMMQRRRSEYTGKNMYDSGGK